MIMPPPLRSGAKPKQHRLVTKKMRDQFMLADCGYVVVVDDDPSLRQMVIKYLEDNNVPTKSASNRTEFNRHFAGTPPSLIILGAPATSSGADTSSADGGLIVAAGASSIRRNGRLP
jgi:hypothetical protein